MDSVFCSFVARFVPFSKDSHLDDTALLRSLALPLSRSLAFPLSRALALSLSRSFALSLTRSPALSLSHSNALSLSLASIGCVFSDLCRAAARLSRSLELSLSRQKRSEESKPRRVFERSRCSGALLEHRWSSRSAVGGSWIALGVSRIALGDIPERSWIILGGFR